MTKQLFISALVKYFSGIAALMILTFIPAGTFAYRQAWLLLGILFIPMFIAGVVMMIKSPELLKKRLNMRESESEQKSVILYSAIMFIAMFVSAGLSYRFNFLMIPYTGSLIASAVLLVGYILWAEVLRENEYLSRTIEVQENQKVIDTGLYGVVRHPMYMATLLIFLSMPLILGSVIAFLISLVYLPIIAKRIRNEEKVLEEGLAGYKEYKQKVRYRLIPYIW
ncbi:MAG TPA: isoprenylcysteine carboxyl methyltransferase [Erysipelotrichaceae bacterium]|nr:isoprenylcysteine carboxyl methyltransferase [Erysipelotrichaceae bacterium]